MKTSTWSYPKRYTGKLLKIITWVLVSFLICVSTVSLSKATESDKNIVFKTKPGPPPGFEELVNPQTTAIDLFYGDRHIGTVLATYTPETLEFDYPEEVVGLIPQVKNTAEVEAALSGSLNTNADKVCLTEIQRDCGYLEPAVAAVIFNEGYFRAHIFVNAFYLENNNIVRNKFLPESETGFSSISSNSLSFSGNKNDDVYSLGSRQIFSYKQSRFQFNWDQSSTQDLSVNNISLQHDKSIWTYEAGVFHSTTRNSSFFNQADLFGARVFSSTNTRTDLEYSYSTNIFLFLSSPSIVEIFKDDKLITVQEYETGNQQIDTRHLPNGSYKITLRITDSRGVTQEEDYFFAKSTLLPPKDQPEYFVELGQIGESTQERVLPEFRDEYLGRTGAAYRLKDNLGVNFEFLQSDKLSALQGGAVYLGNKYNVQSKLLLSNEGDWGIDLNGQLANNNIILNLNFRKVENADTDIDFNEFNLIPQSFSQSTVSASTNFLGGTISLLASQNKRQDEEDSESIGYRYTRPLLRKNRYQINLSSSAFVEDDDTSISFGISFNNLSGKFQFNSDSRYAYQDNDGDTESDIEYSARADYTDKNSTFGDYSLGLHASNFVNSKSIGTRFQTRSALGKADVLYEHIDNNDSDSITRYIGNASFSVYASGKNVAWGGNRTANSGSIIKLDSESIDAPFEVFVNRQPYGFAKSGKSTIVALQPYNEYSIQIKPRGNEFVHFDEKIHRVTLYPGNVETLNWKISPVTILISNAIFKDGSPVEFAKFENTIGFASTDAGGWFQVEIANRDPLILSKKGTPICKIELPNFEVEQGIAVLDEVVCTPILD